MHSLVTHPAKSLRCSIVLWCAIAISIVFGTPIANAAKLYVARTPSASDDNDGSVRKPLRSIARAIERAKPGDFVIVHHGDYRNDDTGWGTGVIPVLNSGEQGKDVRIIAANGAKPLVHSFLLRGVHHVRISGFHFRNVEFRKHPKWKDMPNIIRDVPEDLDTPIDYSQDWEQRRLLIEPAFASYFSLVKKLEYVNGINLEECNSVSVTNNVIDGYWAGIQCRHCTSININTNVISHTVNGIFAFEPAPALTNSSIVRNKIAHSLDIGISIQKGCDNVNVAYNEVTYSGRNHISVQDGNSNCTVRENKLRFGGYYSETMRYPGSSGINIHSSLGGIGVFGNDVSFQIDRTGFDGNGIILDLMLSGKSVSIRNNFVYRNMGSGLNTTKSPNAVIVGNYFIQNGYRTNASRNGAGIKLSQSEDIGHTIAFNLFFENKYASILSEDTIRQQRLLDFNAYFSSRNTPVVWDSFFPGEATYRRVVDLYRATGWERHGIDLSACHDDDEKEDKDDNKRDKDKKDDDKKDSDKKDKDIGKKDERGRDRD